MPSATCREVVPGGTCLAEPSGSFRVIIAINSYGASDGDPYGGSSLRRTQLAGRRFSLWNEDQGTRSMRTVRALKLMVSSWLASNFVPTRICWTGANDASATVGCPSKEIVTSKTCSTKVWPAAKMVAES